MRLALQFAVGEHDHSAQGFGVNTDGAYEVVDLGDISPLQSRSEIVYLASSFYQSAGGQSVSSARWMCWRPT